MESVKLETINLDVNGVKICLTLEQAKALKGILDELFSKGDTVYVPCPYPVYPNTWYPPYMITCSSNSMTIKAQ